MKKLYFFFILLSSLTALKAQIWAPGIGTYWYYTNPGNGAFCSPGYVKYDYYKDSLINGNNCQMIRRYGRSVCQNGPVAGYSRAIYTYTNSNKVVYVNNYTSSSNVQTQAFDTLFWFDAPIGAKWHMVHQSYNCTGTVTCIVAVQDTGHSTFQGVKLRWQKVNYIAQAGGPEQSVTDTIYERFGYLRTDPFNPDNFCSLTTDVQSSRIFRCYGDNQLTNFKFRYSGACDYFVDVSVDELNAAHNDLSIFPNPAGSTLQFSSKNDLWNEALVEMRDALGRTVLKQAFSTSLNIGFLAPGVYVVTVKNDSGLRSFKIIKE